MVSYTVTVLVIMASLALVRFLLQEIFVITYVVRALLRHQLADVLCTYAHHHGVKSMAIEYSGATFSGANSAQNVSFNNTNMCNVEINGVPVFSRGSWSRTADWGDDAFNACIHCITRTGVIYICWWTYPDATHYLCHPDYSFNDNTELDVSFETCMNAYGGNGGQPVIIIKGCYGCCFGCTFCCTLSTSQWSATVNSHTTTISNYPSSTCSLLCNLGCRCSGIFHFTWPNDPSVGCCWYARRGEARVYSYYCSEYCLDKICFTNSSNNGVLSNCYIGRDSACICA